MNFSQKIASVDYRQTSLLLLDITDGRKQEKKEQPSKAIKSQTNFSKPRCKQLLYDDNVLSIYFNQQCYLLSQYQNNYNSKLSNVLIIFQQIIINTVIVKNQHHQIK
ncbi:Hypothetical_protein [Hexamita inflata]|uniref:Hypothetical_protein n=1 Tax=Hexamita inflata TaxID=28002 RepID=A0ABP1HM66_9EUKA